MMQSVEQIREAILAGGLYDDGRPVYAEKYQPYFSATGLWQQPDELAELLHYLQQQHIRSFLNIGTFNGRTFKFIADFLTAQNPNLVCVTVDIEQHPTLVQAPEYQYVIGTSENFAHQRFDLVFIDGAHEYAAAMRDFTLVGQYAKFCVFHDIADQWISELPGGGCTAVWKELKQQCAKTHDIHEFVTADKPTQTMGLGVLAKKPTMRRIIVTPAGRACYLRLLSRHLAAQKAHFDEWRVWVNTDTPEDLQYLQELSEKYDWVKLIPLCVPFNRNMTIYSFYKDCLDSDAVYLRLDDDVIWLEANFVSKMFTFREQRKEFSLVFANIVNNAIISHIYQRSGLLDCRHGKCVYNCTDHVGWHSAEFAMYLHEQFLQDLRRGEISRWRCFPEWHLHDFERVSINSISFFGADMVKFDGEVLPDEEPWMACYLPQQLNKIAAINGNALCVHFAFGPQRVAPEFDEAALLAQYEKFAPVV
jgi:hypothetical protein